ncbi:MAG TPA: amino acid permease [Acidimicrobiales bacterium]|nr:amino acid permease [Acidimicrobiales bacterium]
MSEADKQISRNTPVLTSHANVSTVYPETFGYRLKRIFLGRPFVSEQLAGERINKPVALGVLAPDCISSSAYGAEQILTQLTPAIGLAAFSLLVPIMFVILGVLLLVTLSYLDVIGFYNITGGSYIVVRDNFGPKTASVTAVALLIDYVVTVAVQCSAGTAALTSAVPGLFSLSVPITVAIVLLLIYGNLRGIKEAGAYFAFPTYFFISMMTLTIAVGTFKFFAGLLHHIAQPSVAQLVDHHLGSGGHGFLMGVAFLTLLRAYANGGSSLTGLEAISDGVSSFRKPEARNARIVMVAMASTLAFLLIGTTMLARWTHALPYAKGSPTVVSQEVLAVFGAHGVGHVIYYLVQLATMLILYTGGNTSFNGFPYLTNFVANDRFLPRQLTKRGHRLAFSNGILALGSMALVLVIVFQARVNSLIALYAIGVFTAFTMAGAGMARRHWTRRDHRWRLGFVINALSSVVTLAIALIFAVVKFTEGAWIVVVSGPLMILGLQYMHRQYSKEHLAFEASKRGATGGQFRLHRLVIFIDSYDLATERALQYCNTLNAYSVRAVHFDIDPFVTRKLEADWGAPDSASFAIGLEIVECDDRRVDRAALELVADIVRDPDVFCMVILPRRGFSSRIQRLLHDRTADSIATAVMHIPRTAATIIPYRMGRVNPDENEIPEELMSDEVRRGGVRENAHLEADLKLAQRSGSAAPIGGLKERQSVEIAGRVRSMTITHEGAASELRCVIADPTGSVTLVFQGRAHVPGIERGTRLMVSGTVSSLHREAVILNPQYEIVAAPAMEEGSTPQG